MARRTCSLHNVVLALTVLLNCSSDAMAMQNTLEGSKVVEYLRRLGKRRNVHCSGSSCSLKPCPSYVDVCLWLKLYGWRVCKFYLYQLLTRLMLVLAVPVVRGLGRNSIQLFDLHSKLNLRLVFLFSVATNSTKIRRRSNREHHDNSPTGLQSPSETPPYRQGPQKEAIQRLFFLGSRFYIDDDDDIFFFLQTSQHSRQNTQRQ